jgi:hypothetical protein
LERPRENESDGIEDQKRNLPSQRCSVEVIDVKEPLIFLKLISDPYARREDEDQLG